MHLDFAYLITRFVSRRLGSKIDMFIGIKKFVLVNYKRKKELHWGVVASRLDVYIYFLSRMSILLSVCIFVIIFFGSFSGMYAQSDTLSGVGYYVDLQGVDYQDGHIVTLSQGEYVLAVEEYDSKMVGVVDLSPSLSLDLIGSEGAVPVVGDGYANVLVSGANGLISTGDWVTSSTIAGVGVKATVDGFVLGQAMEPFNGDVAEDQGMIRVAIDIHYSDQVVGGSGVRLQDEARESLFDLLNVFRTASSVPAPQAFRFILAGLVALFALVFGFFTFGRVAQRGVEAIGRNPLARRTIIVGLIFNVIVSIVIILAGIVVAFFVIRL